MGDDRESVHKFDGTGFQVWKATIEAVMLDKEIMSAVLLGRPIKPQGADAAQMKVIEKAQEKYDKDNNKAKSLILRSLSRNIAEEVISCPTAKEIWERLLEIQQQRNKLNKGNLKREFHSAHMHYKERMASYFSRIEGLQRSLIDVGVDYDDEAFIDKIITSLPERYSSFMTIWNTMDSTKQTKSNLLSCLLSEERQIDCFEKQKQHVYNEALYTDARASNGRGRGIVRGRGGGRGRGRGAHYNVEKTNEGNGLIIYISAATILFTACILGIIYQYKKMINRKVTNNGGVSTVHFERES